MKIWQKTKAILGFERTSADFELLETEKGEPTFLGGWNEERTEEEEQSKVVPNELSEAEKLLWREFRCDINKDIIIRRFMLCGRFEAIAVLINGMADADAVNDFVIRDGMRKQAPEGSGAPDAKYAIENVFTYCEAENELSWQKVKAAILDGKTAVMYTGCGGAVILDTRGYEHRNISTPENEKVVRGPHEGFCENLRSNITLIRRLIRTEDLVCELRDSGGKNRLMAAIIYREGSANITLINEVKRRLAKVNTRMVMNIGALEQLTEEHTLSPFPQLLSTERPDRAASFIMQGHVTVLFDGSPFANIMPTTLFALMASPEDFDLREPQGTVIRFVRYTGAVLSILLPGMFLALAMHHQGLLSTEVLSTVLASRKMVFGTIGVELVFLLLVFQMIREAGLRVPGSIGQAIGIIGGLILGQAAVAANLASSVVLIVVALSGLGNFCIPDYSTQIAAAYFRILYVASAWMAGLLGIACMSVILIAWLSSLKSYGVPFLAPFAPTAYSVKPMIRRGRLSMHKKAVDYTNTVEREK